MSRRHIISNSLVLCAALAASSLIGSGCSSSDSNDSISAGASGKTAQAGRSNGSAGSAGSDSTPAGTGNDVDSAGMGGNGGAETGAGATAGTTGGTDPGGGAAGEGDAGASPAAGGSDSPGGAGGSDNRAAIAHGLELTTTNLCTTCHQADYSGYAIYPNITSDMDTGIGSWSDEEVKQAIIAGVDKDKGKLCASMLKFPFSDSEVADVIAYLRSLPVVDHAVTQVCPGHINP
jgi:hypothetical protein